MEFHTDSRRVEVEYTRGYIFFLRLPHVGEVLWTRAFGREAYPWRTVNERLQRRAYERDAHAAIDDALDKAS
jgi:hypothetical protein